jgi:hypothetical protein
MENSWLRNEVHSYIPTKQRLGNKTLFTNTIDNGIKQTRYFAGTDAEIYFDEIYIDEVVQIQYQIQQNTMPLFGYNSYVYDQIARGSRVINGSFTINFTQANYLYDVLNTLSKQTTSNDITIVKDLENTTDEFDDNNTYGINSKKTDIRMGNSDGPMLDETFEIVLSYGDARQSNTSNSSTMLALTGVVLTGCSQVLGINGDPIYETYTFIARDVASVVKNNTEKQSATTAIEEDVITIKSLSYSEKIDTSTNKPYGTISLSYRSKYPINEIKMQLKHLGIEMVMTSIAAVDQHAMGLPSTITYRVSNSWRTGIKEYYNKVAVHDTNASSINVDILFAYENTTKIISDKKLKLESVYAND